MSIPGVDVIGAVQSVLGNFDFLYYKYIDSTTNSAGQYILEYEDPVVLRGSIQPISSEHVQNMGLNASKKYKLIYVKANIEPVDRTRASDKIVYASVTYKVKDVTNWFSTDGWCRIVCQKVA